MSLTMNGEFTDFAHGERLMDILIRRGFQIPLDCNHSEFRPVESSDVCAVEVDGRLVRACSTIAQDGMTVFTTAPRDREARNGDFDEDTARKIIDAELWREGPLLPILHALQERFGFIPREVEPLIASVLNITRAEVHGVVTFYHDFRRERAGRHVLQLCRAEACQSMGGEGTAQRLLKHLGLEWGGTTPDGKLSVEPVYCLGLCATAPGAMLDGAPLGRVSADQLEELAAEARR